MHATVYFAGTRSDLFEVMRRLPRIMAGVEGDTSGAAQAMQARVGVGLMSKIKQAFIVKSRGGTDEAGIKWPELKQATIANRRPAPRKKRGERPIGLLTVKEDETWRKLFGQWYAIFRFKYQLGEAEAKERAAKVAWAKVKKDGAKTKLEVYGHRQVDILRDTGEMLRAITPGVDGAPPPEGQILRLPPGRVIVGISKKPWHHFGVPGRLPKRLLWPEDGNLPQSWWDDLLELYQSGLVRLLVLLLEARQAA